MALVHLAEKDEKVLMTGSYTIITRLLPNNGSPPRTEGRTISKLYVDLYKLYVNFTECYGSPVEVEASK